MNNSITGLISDAVMGKTSISTKPPAPARVIASMGQFRDKVVVKWSKVTGAVGYLVYRYADNKWDTLGETTQDTLEDSPATKGQRYYTVIAKSKANVWGSFSRYAIGYVDPNLKRGGTKLEPPAAVSAVIDKKTGYATLNWNKVEGAEEYNVWEKRQGESNWNFKSSVNNKKLFIHLQFQKEKNFISTR